MRFDENPGIPTSTSKFPKLANLIRYPFRDRDFAQLQAQPTPEPPTNVPKTSRPVVSLTSDRVLIADSNQGSRLAWHQRLESLGLRTDFAEDGEEALEKLVAEDYAGALLGDDLEVIDGLEVASALKKSSAGSTLSPSYLPIERDEHST